MSSARRHRPAGTGTRCAGLAAALALGAFAYGCTRPTDAAVARPGQLEDALAPTQTLPASPELLKLGRATYETQCSACHGPQGDGEGEAAYLLYPRPRDFTSGQYRLVSTWDGVPTDEDLYRTISRGMPGSAMPSWAHLPERTRWGLVHYVKAFSKRPLTIHAARPPDADGNDAAGPVQVPPEPPYDKAAEARARETFSRSCAPCHGSTGRGDGQQEQTDSKGYATRPRDLTLGVYKGSPDPSSVYKRVVAGLPGSPMPQSGYLHGQPAWDLVHYVRSLSSDEQRAKVEMKRFLVVAPRVAALPAHPDSALWRAAPPVDMHLMPLWWRTERPEEITVRALHDGQELALLLSWSDASQDATAMRPQDFRDAAAVAFSLSEEPPFFAMGQRGSPVNIWMWKAERQADLQPAFQDLEKVYPNVGIDSYPNLLRSALEQPMRNALTLESDPRFVTAWGAGNIVADPTRRSPTEDLVAEGFGTLRSRGRSRQNVEAVGVHEKGAYRVQLRRRLGGDGKDAVSLRPGSRAAVSFAVWNGSAGDRDGKKSVTIWQELRIAP
jgi:mono/diheme cytochrome c family protein